MKAKSEFKITKWDEKTYLEISADQKMTKATVAFSFSGDLEGTALTEWVMYYPNAGNADPSKSHADYLGFIRVEGKMGGKSGSFVIEDKGSYVEGVAKSILHIVVNSGTDGFKGIKGSGRYNASHSSSAFELDYTI